MTEKEPYRRSSSQKPMRRRPGSGTEPRSNNARSVGVRPSVADLSATSSSTVRSNAARKGSATNSRDLRRSAPSGVRRPNQEQRNTAQLNGGMRSGAQRGGSYSASRVGGSAEFVSARAARPSKNKRAFPKVILATVAFVAVVGVVASGVFFGAFTLDGLSPKTEIKVERISIQPTGLSEQERYSIDYEPTVSSLENMPDSGETVVGFSLVTDDAGYVPSLSDDQKAAIQAVLDKYVSSNRTVGFVFVDLRTGSGYGYNADAEVYSASSIKAHLATFACQDRVENGKVSLSSFKSHAEDAVIWSDNDAYYRLRRASGGYGNNNAFDSWVVNLGLDPSVSEGSFPYYSARESIQLWMNTYLYLQSGDSELTTWLKEIFSKTNVSMIRSGVQGVPMDSPGELAPLASLSAAPGWVESGLLTSVQHECVVYNKAGWINGSEDNSVCDAGIIVVGDEAYLMSILTSAPDSAGNRQLVADLAGALWASRGTLQPEGLIKA